MFNNFRIKIEDLAIFTLYSISKLELVSMPDYMREIEQPSHFTLSPTKAGWLYLAVVLDLFSRRFLEWAISKRITRRLIHNTLNMVICRRRLQRELVFYSDRGSHIVANLFRKN